MNTAESLKELLEQREKMMRWLKSDAVCEAGKDWLRMELHNDVRYMMETQKKNRPVRRSLERKLKYLISLIISRLEAERNG